MRRRSSRHGEYGGLVHRRSGAGSARGDSDGAYRIIGHRAYGIPPMSRDSFAIQTLAVFPQLRRCHQPQWGAPDHRTEERVAKKSYAATGTANIQEIQTDLATRSRRSKMLGPQEQSKALLARHRRSGESVSPAQVGARFWRFRQTAGIVSDHALIAQLNLTKFLR